MATWTIDPAHTRVVFAVRHMMISNVYGQFHKVNGTVDFNEEDPVKSSVEVQIEAASIDTREPNRDAHLRSPDFLNAEQYPYITFKSRRIEKIDDKHGRIHGDLTIRDVTRPVTLDVEYAGQARSPYGTVQAGFTAETKINRKDFNLNWNVALETGGWLVGDEIKITIELELIKQAEAEAQAAQA